MVFMSEYLDQISLYVLILQHASILNMKEYCLVIEGKNPQVFSNSFQSLIH